MVFSIRLATKTINNKLTIEMKVKAIIKFCFGALNTHIITSVYPFNYSLNRPIRISLTYTGYGVY